MNPWQRVRLARARRASRLPLQQRLLEQALLPAAGARVDDLELVALDFETTGLDVQRDHVVAAGWVRIVRGRIVLASARELHVRTARPEGVGQSAAIHGILDSDLDSAVEPRALVEALLPDLHGRVIVAHAAAIERGFLARLLRDLGGVPVPNVFLDTMTIEQRLLQAGGVQVRERQADLSLDACRRRRGLPAHAQHSAASDALACAELLLAQLAEFGAAGRVRLADLR
ncbi:MAG TPA: exonuclease domain-containing protein [Steroidobacteraceae bacterium]|nr:exonuclease domain-containing protein [Steroidobacteraceae bacterium]